MGPTELAMNEQPCHPAISTAVVLSAYATNLLWASVIASPIDVVIGSTTTAQTSQTRQPKQPDPAPVVIPSWRSVVGLSDRGSRCPVSVGVRCIGTWCIALGNRQSAGDHTCCE
jgi:hypothetical protein